MLYGRPFQIYSDTYEFCNSPVSLLSNRITLTTLILHRQQPTSSHPRSSQRESRFRSPLHNISLGFSRFARHYSGNNICSLFLKLLRGFTSLRFLHAAMNSLLGNRTLLRLGLPIQKSPGSNVCWQLPEAYRSLLRLSSPFCAKASTVRPYYAF